MNKPLVICPQCLTKASLDEVLTAQSNQNVIYTCTQCSFMMKNIETSKG